MSIDFSKDISKIVNEYTEDVINATNIAIEETSKSTVKKLKNAGIFKNRTGKYRKGWTVKDGEKRLGIKQKIIHNKTSYQLTHLLEFGHVNRDGSRTKSYPHISIIEEEANNELEKEIKKRL